MKILIFLLIVIFARIDARLFEGQCRERPAPIVSPFNFKLYLGEWYEVGSRKKQIKLSTFNLISCSINQIEWYDDEYPTFDECIKFTYTGTSSNTFDMALDLADPTNGFIPAQYLGNGNVAEQSLLSTLPLAGPVFSEGKLRTTFGSGQPSRVNHQILATDYENYAFVWDCANVNQTHYNERMWYFDRNPTPSKRPEKVNELIKHFDQQYIRKTYHGVECGWEL